MKKFCVDASLIGTKKHVVCDEDGYVLSDSVPRDSWHLTGRIKTSPSAKCLDTLFRLARVEVPSPPAKHVVAMKLLTSGTLEGVQWQHALPKDDFRIFFENLMSVASSHFHDLSFEYFEGAWTAGSRVLSSLKPAKIDEEQYDSFVSQNPNVASLLTFEPNRSGYAKPVVYDRFSTKTGRLTVASGPDILTLKKEFRSVLKTSFEDGVIAYVDFRALEARIVLAENGKTCDAGDLYQDIAMTMFGGEVSRDVVKTAVISELYGISRASLRARLRVSDDKLDDFIGVVRKHFGIEDLRKRLEDESRATNAVVNKFGRKVYVAQGQENTLVNSFAQSTGVDVAMSGFDVALRRLGQDGIRPLYVLHDALLLDVRRDRVEDVKNLTSVSVPPYESQFPVKVDFLRDQL